jgi:hypothetical protein
MRPSTVPTALPSRKPRAAKMVAPPRIAIQAARLHRLRPEAAAVIEEMLDKLLAEVMPPGER